MVVSMTRLTMSACNRTYNKQDLYFVVHTVLIGYPRLIILFLNKDDCSKSERNTENTAVPSIKVQLPADIIHVGIR